MCGGGVGFLFLFLENSAKCHRDQVEGPQNRIQETCAIFAARVPRVPSVISENRDGCEEAVAQTCAIGTPHVLLVILENSARYHRASR